LTILAKTLSIYYKTVHAFTALLSQKYRPVATRAPGAAINNIQPSSASKEVSHIIHLAFAL